MDEDEKKMPARSYPHAQSATPVDDSVGQGSQKKKPKTKRKVEETQLLEATSEENSNIPSTPQQHTYRDFSSMVTIPTSYSGKVSHESATFEHKLKQLAKAAKAAGAAASASDRESVRLVAPSSTSSSGLVTSRSICKSLSFPVVLHYLLEHAEECNYDLILSWQYHGRAFQVHDPDRFVKEVMPHFFQQTRYPSFLRQLALYDFQRIKNKSSPDDGCYYHEMFLRGIPHLSTQIPRTRAKGSQKYINSPEPDFSSMPIVGLKKRKFQQQSAAEQPVPMITTVSEQSPGQVVTATEQSNAHQNDNSSTMHNFGILGDSYSSSVQPLMNQSSISSNLRQPESVSDFRNPVLSMSSFPFNSSLSINQQQMVSIPGINSQLPMGQQQHLASIATPSQMSIDQPPAQILSSNPIAQTNENQVLSLLAMAMQQLQQQQVLSNLQSIQSQDSVQLPANYFAYDLTQIGTNYSEMQNVAPGSEGMVSRTTIVNNNYASNNDNSDLTITLSGQTGYYTPRRDSVAENMINEMYFPQEETQDQELMGFLSDVDLEAIADNNGRGNGEGGGSNHRSNSTYINTNTGLQQQQQLSNQLQLPHANTSSNSWDNVTIPSHRNIPQLIQQSASTQERLPSSQQQQQYPWLQQILSTFQQNLEQQENPTYQSHQGQLQRQQQHQQPHQSSSSQQSHSESKEGNEEE